MSLYGPLWLSAQLAFVTTVILLLPKGMSEWDDDLEPGETLRMGEEIGELQQASP